MNNNTILWNTFNSLNVEPLYLNLDIQDFIESYLKLINNPENSLESPESEFLPESPFIELGEIGKLDSFHHGQYYCCEETKVSNPVSDKKTKGTHKSKSKTREKYRKDRAVPKSQHHMFNNSSQYIDKHCKRRRLFVRKNSNNATKGIPSSLQFNFPVITFHTLEVKK